MLQLDDRRHDDGDAGLVVDRAATEDVAVFDHGSERVTLPVGGVGFDDIHVAEDGDGFQRRVAALPCGGEGGGVADRLDLDGRGGEARGDELILEEVGVLRGLVGAELARFDGAEGDGARQEL